MHLHLPKAIHGWREFAKEVGIIVLGVLIALGLEQVVQEWRWHEQVKTTRDALISEIEYSALWAEERIGVQQCLRDRVGELTSKLRGGTGNWAGDPIVLGQPHGAIGLEIVTELPLVYRAPHRPWLSDEWETAKSGGIIDHMDRGDARTLEFIYRNIRELEALQVEETSLEPQVGFLSFDQTLEPQARVQALVTFGRLDYLNGMEAQASRQMLANTRLLPLGPIKIGPTWMTFAAARQRIVDILRERYGNCVAQ